MEQAIDQHCGGDEKEPDGLISIEQQTLFFAADAALLLLVVVFQLPVQSDVGLRNRKSAV